MNQPQPMTQPLLKRIADLDDRKAIRVLEYYAARVFEGSQTSPQEMIEGIPQELREKAPFDRVLEMSGKERGRPLPEGESATLARKILSVFAQDPAFAPSLAQALEAYRDDKLLLGEVLDTGIALSMVIVACTFQFKATIGSFTIVKTAADATLIEAIAKVIEASRKHFP
jgi:hypothetical protein